HVKARVAVEQASTFGWERYVGGAGCVIGMKTFGASAPLKKLQRKFGFEPEQVVTVAKDLLVRKQRTSASAAVVLVEESQSLVPSVAEETKEGQSFPLGATLCADGANFSVYSKHATGIELLFFDDVDDVRPKRVIPIDPATNRTYHYWHVFVAGLNV